mgnify:CR=1 FL=1|tara:strand:+ start:97 stop:768 length:672 start_codon:yes stop_codon:yes gene_type:complete
MTHQRKSKKIIIYLFIFSTLVTINNLNLYNDLYTIKKLNINGLNNQETKEIYNDLKTIKNKNIFFLEKKNILKKIYSNKKIEKISIFRNYPSSLNIKIEKTKFLAVTKKSNNDYFIGTNKNLIKVDKETLDIPFIFGDVDLDSFFYLKKIIDSSNLKFNKIKNLYYFKSKRWDLVTKDGLIIKMPLNLTVEKLNLIYEIIKKKEFKDKKIIDLRQFNMIVING